MTLTKEERSENIRMIRDSASAVTEGDLRRIRALRFTRPGIDPEVWARMADLGWIGLMVQEDAGGIGLGVLEFAALAEELGRALVAEPLIAAASIAPDLPDGLRASAIDGSLVILPVWQEDLGAAEISGSDPQRLTGSAAGVLFAPGAHGFAVQTAQGAVHVEAHDCEMSSTDTLDGGNVSRLGFEGVPTQPVGDLSVARERATLATAAYLLGAAERAFEITLDYLGVREQFGRPIGSFQTLQHRAVDMKISLEITRATLGQCLSGFEAADNLSMQQALASRAIARASDTAMKIARDSTQMHGAIGITDEHDIGLFTRKVAATYQQFGTARQHRRRYLDLAGRGDGAGESRPTAVAE